MKSISGQEFRDQSELIAILANIDWKKIFLGTSRESASEEEIIEFSNRYLTPANAEKGEKFKIDFDETNGSVRVQPEFETPKELAERTEFYVKPVAEWVATNVLKILRSARVATKTWRAIRKAA